MENKGETLRMKYLHLTGQVCKLTAIPWVSLYYLCSVCETESETIFNSFISTACSHSVAVPYPAPVAPVHAPVGLSPTSGAGQDGVHQPQHRHCKEQNDDCGEDLVVNVEDVYVPLCLRARQQSGI